MIPPLGRASKKQRPQSAASFLFPDDFPCKDFRVQQILFIRMASVEEEELAMAVEGSGVHGNPLFRKELSYFLIALPAAQHGGTEEDNLSHLRRIRLSTKSFTWLSMWPL